MNYKIGDKIKIDERVVKHNTMISNKDDDKVAKEIMAKHNYVLTIDLYDKVSNHPFRFKEIMFMRFKETIIDKRVTEHEQITSRYDILDL